MNRMKLGVVAIATLCVTTLSAQSYPDWSKQTHSNDVEPNYEKVFLSDRVHRIDIKIDAEDWSAMWADMDENLGGGGRMGGGGGASSQTEYSPLNVPCTLSYDGTDWYKVGVRFKGNSSLMQAFQRGVKKLSMKLDFDEFEKQYPELKNQRFYGFKQLNLNSGFNDTSFIRDAVVADLFRDFGMVSAQTSFCEVYMDFGEGAQYYGLYTLVEEVDDSVVKTHFADGSGNIYKPDERAGSFAEGSYNEAQFYLKSNKKSPDYSDVKALYDALHSSTRTSDIAAWKSELERVFDVDTFLKWLAVSTTILNWDSYGNMAHNYFLYNNPESGKLVWIPWDHNEAMQWGRNAYEPGTLSYANEWWPLIKYLIEVDEYKVKYDGYLREFIDEVFTPSKMVAIYDNYYNMLKPYVYREVTARTYMMYYTQFDESIETLKSHVTERRTAVEEYLR